MNVTSIMDRLTRQAIDGELNRWGRWIERHADYEGYPKASAFISAIEGRGGLVNGHRVLCLDMPDYIYAVHGRVLRLPQEEREAIFAWFVIRVKEDGTIWGIAEKCEKIGIDPLELRALVNKARQRIAGVCP